MTQAACIEISTYSFKQLTVMSDLEKFPLKAGDGNQLDEDNIVLTGINGTIVNTAGPEHEKLVNETNDKFAKLLVGGLIMG